VVTPLTWLYVPVRIAARLGAHSELVQQAASKRIPAAAIRSMFGVVVIRLPYAESACAAWSSAITKTMSGRVSGTPPCSPGGPTTGYGGAAARAARPDPPA